MPKYLDHHKVVNMPPEAAQQIVADIKAKRPNKFGAIPFNAFMAKNFSQSFTPGTSSNTFRITGTGSAARKGQFVWRITF